MKKKEGLSIATFGSATVRNVEDILQSLASERTANLDGEDQLTVLDFADSRVQKHLDYVEKKGHKNVRVVKADMNEHPLANNSVDMLFVDHTMAFNVVLDENGDLDQDAVENLYRTTLMSAAKVLTAHGRCILSVNTHPETDQQENDYYLRCDEQLGKLFSSAVKESKLDELLEQTGLEVLSRQDGVRLVLRKMKKQKIHESECQQATDY
ncbi:hypothetical protein ACFL6I_28455 [candidate division KSB1 bacterium]